MLWFYLILTLALISVGGVFLFRKSGRVSQDNIRTRTNLMIAVPRPKDDPQADLKSMIAPMEAIFSNLGGIRDVVGERHLTFEIATEQELITFYMNVPSELVDFVEKQITSQYSDAIVEKAPYPNFFVKEGRVASIQLQLKKPTYFPLRTYQTLAVDGLGALTNALSKLADSGAGAAIQVAFRPVADNRWAKQAHQAAKNLQQGKGGGGSIGEGVLKGLGGLVTTTQPEENKSAPKPITSGQEDVIRAVETKASKTGFEVVIRLVAAAADDLQARSHLKTLIDSFLQFNAPELNALVPAKIPEGEVLSNYVLRQFGNSRDADILNTEELATIFHLPTAKTETPNVRWLKAKRLVAPENLPKEGILLGKNVFRGMEKQVRISRDDRRRHIYVIGKTGTGKSTWMQNLALQDINNGEGVCVIDPHGDMIEWLLQRIPKLRVDDVIHFYPPDIDRPLGLNLLEAKTPAEKDMVVSEMISIFYKLFDPNSSGIVGPIFEHYMRNAMLLLLADERGGATLIDIPRVFTDKAFREAKLTSVTDPTVQRFWKEEFVQAEKSNQVGELFSYIISKIGRFISNEMMRNIVGQAKSSFDIRDVMDNKKILLVNLAKGLTGDINSNLLGFILVSKMQMAALSRADMPESARQDFYLYIDEFQNVTTDSIATILSEARKYKLNLTIAHQFVAQLEEKIRDAVFGNVGSLVAFTIGAPDAEAIGKQFEPDVSQNDLINIENRNAYVKLMIDGMLSRPFTLQALPPMGEGNPKIAEAIRQLARLKFGKDKRLVEMQVGERIKYTKDTGLGGV
ncbi:MAG: type IV secretory system conjugative DNA transfer family protein [Patescibacteria group bacterium]